MARLLARLVIAVLLAASLLPIANWIPSERTAPWYGEAIRTWTFGTVVSLAIGGLVAWISLARGIGWRPGALTALLCRFDPASPRAVAVVTASALLLYAGVAWVVFERRPLLIDEVVFLFQARTYAMGRLYLPVDPDPAFRSVLHLVEHQGRWFGHFPPGWPALLAAGELLRAPWLVGPVVGAVAVGAWGLVLRRAEPSGAIRAGAMILFAAAPFVAFLAGSQMNHTATLMWLLVAVAAWLRVREGGGAVAAMVAGSGLGMAAITRPAEALAFGLPAGLWALGWAWRTRRIGRLAIIAIAAALPVGWMLWVNHATTGSLWVSGYQLLWGNNQALGFHPAPSGPDHTVGRGFELVTLYLLRLNRYLFEAPVPGLVAAGVALLAVRRIGPIDRYLLAASAALIIVYFAYWHDGFYFGPRFFLPMAPVIALWTARLPSVLRERAGELAGRWAASTLAISLLGALGVGIPERAAQNAAFQPSFRFDVDRAADAGNVRDAVILVRETWGATLLARLWALGASRPDAERYYRTIDSCVLEHAIAENEALPRPDLGRLGPLMADSSRLMASPFSPDSSERVLDGARYDQRCLARIAEDRDGTALLAPTLLSRRDDLVFVRDLHERNRRILAAHPAKSVYLLRRGAADSVPRFIPVSRDSIMGLDR